MNGASIAYGLRAALSNHEGTALHRAAHNLVEVSAFVDRAMRATRP